VTRAQFFARRAVMAVEQRGGITRCPPGSAQGAQPAGIVHKRQRGHFIARVVATITVHPTDETGEAQPIRRRKERSDPAR
jgi:hypothetical protein